MRSRGQGRRLSVFSTAGSCTAVQHCCTESRVPATQSSHHCYDGFRVRRPWFHRDELHRVSGLASRLKRGIAWVRASDGVWRPAGLCRPRALLQAATSAGLQIVWGHLLRPNIQ